jgi:hypothetical protein
MLGAATVRKMIKDALDDYHAKHSAPNAEVDQTKPPNKPKKQVTVPYTKEELEVKKGVVCSPSFKEDLKNKEYLLEKSKIDKLLLKALTDAGYPSKFDKDKAPGICASVLLDKVNKMSDDEKCLFHFFITDHNFPQFSVLWQDIHTEIQKKIQDN